MINVAFFKRTGVVFLLKILIALTGFLIQVQLSRYVGIQQYGLLTLVFSVVNVLVLFPEMGMNTGIIRDIAAVADEGIRKWKIKITLASFFVFFVGTALIWYVFGDFILDKLTIPNELLSPILVYTGVLALSNILGGVLQGYQKNVYNDTISLTASLIRMALLYGFLMQSASVSTAILIFILSELAAAVIRVVLIGKRHAGVEMTAQPRAEVRKYLWYCVPLFFISSISIVQGSLHRFLVGGLLDSYSVGVMKICENYSSVLGLFVAPFITMWPVMSEYYHSNRLAELKELFHQASTVITMLVMPALVGMSVCYADLFSIFSLSASDSQSLFWVFVIFCVGIAYDAIIGPAGALLNMTEYSRIGLYNSLLLLVCTLIFNVTLIPWMGLIGAAAAFSLSHIVVNTLNALQNYRLFDMQPYGMSQLGLILAGIPAYLVLHQVSMIGVFHGWEHIVYAMGGAYLVYGFIFVLFYRKRVKSLANHFKRKK